MSLNRTLPPPIHHAVDFSYVLPRIHEQRLDNGLPLWWLPQGVQEVCEVTMVFPAGLWQEPKPAVAQAVAALIRNGTKNRTAQQISEAIEFYGATLKPGAGNDFGTLSLFCLTKHLTALLPIIHEVITQAIFPDHELALYKQNAVQRLSVSMRQCEFVANQQIDAALYGLHHPYGRLTRPEKIEAITREDLLAFHQSQWALQGTRIFMTGRIGDAEVKAVNAVFGSLPLSPSEGGGTKLSGPLKEELVSEVTGAPAPSLGGGRGEATMFAPAAPTDHKQRIINDPNGVQGAIRIARNGIPRTHPDYPKLVVLNTLFGGYFGSRLMSNIREDKGYTYGIYSSLNSWLHGADINIHTEAGREVCEAAILEVYKEMQKLREEPAEEDELLLVKNYLLGGLLGDLDNPFQTLNRWRTLILNGQDVETFNRNISVYKSITAQEVQALAQEWLRPEDFLELVVV